MQPKTNKSTCPLLNYTEFECFTFNTFTEKVETLHTSVA